MSADLFEQLGPVPALRVEITSPGRLRDGRRSFTVDYVERDGCRVTVYACTNHAEAEATAIWCGGDGVPVWDRTVPA